MVSLHTIFSLRNLDLISPSCLFECALDFHAHPLNVISCFPSLFFGVIWQVNNFEDLWAATVGASSKWVVSSAITVTTFLACIAYAMIIGDLFSAMAATAGVQVFKPVGGCSRARVAYLSFF